MSRPKNGAERAQELRTLDVAGPTGNVVSTACPECGTRFALVAKLDAEGWRLRCTVCGWHGDGELK